MYLRCIEQILDAAIAADVKWEGDGVAKPPHPEMLPEDCSNFVWVSLHAWAEIIPREKSINRYHAYDSMSLSISADLEQI